MGMDVGDEAVTSPSRELSPDLQNTTTSKVPRRQLRRQPIVSGSCAFPGRPSGILAIKCLSGVSQLMWTMWYKTHCSGMADFALADTIGYGVLFGNTCNISSTPSLHVGEASILRMSSIEFGLWDSQVSALLFRRGHCELRRFPAPRCQVTLLPERDT